MLFSAEMCLHILVAVGNCKTEMRVSWISLSLCGSASLGLGETSGAAPLLQRPPAAPGGIFPAASCLFNKGVAPAATWRICIQWQTSKYKTGSNRFRSYISVYKLQKHSFALYIRHFTQQLVGCRLLSLRKKPLNTVIFLWAFCSFPVSNMGKAKVRIFILLYFIELSALGPCCQREAAFDSCASEERHHPPNKTLQTWRCDRGDLLGHPPGLENKSLSSVR